MAATSHQQFAVDSLYEILHEDSDLYLDPQPVASNYGPFQRPDGTNSQQNGSDFANEPFSYGNMNNLRSPFHTAPPYNVPQSQVHELRGYSTDPQPRHDPHIGINATSGVLFNRTDMANVDYDIQNATDGHTDMGVDHLNIFTRANDAATSLIENFVKLCPTTFFYTEYLKALETLTALPPRTIQEIITQVLESALPPVYDIATLLIRSFVKLCPTTFFYIEYLKALETLTSLPPRTIQGIISQILEGGSPEVLHTKTSFKSSNASSSAFQSLRITNQSISSATTSDSQAVVVSEPINNNQHFEQSACTTLHDKQSILKRASEFLSKRRANRCQPTTDSQKLCRDENNIYQCTFKCGARFSRKPELKRHEEEANYPTQGYVCDVDPVITIANIRTCAYCRVQNPSMEHIHIEHKDRVPYCHEKELDARGKIFMRKTRYEDHVKKVHPALPLPEYVTTSHFFVKSKVPRWCGFCEDFQVFNDSKARNNHMADHFEHGLDMTTWKDPADLSEIIDEDSDSDGDGDGNNNSADNEMDEDEDTIRGHQSQSKYGARANRTPNINEYSIGGFSTFPPNKIAWSCFSEGAAHLWQYDDAISAGSLKRHNLSPAVLIGLGAVSGQSIGIGDKYVLFKVPNHMKFLLNDSRTRVKYCLQRKDALDVEFLPSQQPVNVFTHLKETKSSAMMLYDQLAPIWHTSLHVKRNSTKGNLDVDLKPRNVGSRCAELAELTAQPARNVTNGRSELESDIWTAMVPCKSQNFFLPDDELERLISFERVYPELKFSSPDYLHSSRATIANIIVKQCKHLFALLIYIDKGSTILNFIHNDITDRNLPLRKSDIDNLPFLSSWSPRTILAFCREQWCFIAPIFSLGQHHEFDDLTVLPFIQVDKSQESVMDKISGGYSEVWGVRVHPAHLRVSHSKLADRAPVVAIKQLFSRSRREFELEAQMLKRLGSLRHSNIVELLATYRIDGRYHLMFPWASMNLKSFWRAHPNPQWSRDSLSWDLTQVRGIVSGLRSIHNFEQQESRAVDESQLLVTTAIENGHKLFGRHGDIKPQNILWFKGSGDIDDGGILKLADFGTGTFHKRDSRSRIDPRTIVSTLTYEPPELELALKISREYDIWSLGCVFLEFITWRLCGADMVEAFAEARGEEDLGIINDKFFSVQIDTKSKKAYLRHGVCQWILRLRSHQKCSGVIHDLLDLVQHHLLVIIAENRISSTELELKLNKLWAKAQIDSDYLLKSVPRYRGTASKTSVALESVAEDLTSTNIDPAPMRDTRAY